MSTCGHRAPAFVLAVIVTALPLLAQTQDEKIQQLQQRLDELLHQATSIQTELNALKGNQPDPRLAVALLPRCTVRLPYRLPKIEESPWT